MASRRDELRAHQFLKQRAVSALVVHQTDPEQPPFRRPMVGAMWGLGLALLGLAVAGVVSFFHHDGSLQLKNGENVLVTADGTKYVYLKNKLWQVANLSSAQLALGSNKPIQSVSASQLAKYPHGPEIGIAGAPDQLPAASKLQEGKWNLCSQPTLNKTKKLRLYKSVLTIGTDPSGGTVVDSSRGLVAQANGAGAYYLIWQGYRHKLDDPSAFFQGVAPSASAVPVNPVVLESIPTGKEIAPIRVPDPGAPSTAFGSEVAQVRSGQVYVADSNASPDTASQYYLVVGNKVRRITKLQGNMQLHVASASAAYGSSQPKALDLPPDYQPAPVSATSGQVSDAPADLLNGVLIPSQDASKNSVCAAFTPGTPQPTLNIGASIPGGGITIGGRDQHSGVALVDRFVMPTGTASLIRVVGNQSSGVVGTTALVTDGGKLFPFMPSPQQGDQSGDVTAILGYASKEPVKATITSSLASRLPRGVVLDPKAAMRPQTP